MSDGDDFPRVTHSGQTKTRMREREERTIERLQYREMRKRNEMEEERKERQLERRSWSLCRSKDLKALKLC